MAYLLIISGTNVGTSYHLKNCPLSGGRDVTRDIQIVDQTVSRSHFRILKNESGFVIEEEPGTKNGMFFNDQRVSFALLADGDRVRVGKTMLTFYDTDDAGKIDAIAKAHQLSKATIAPTSA